MSLNTPIGQSFYFMNPLQLSRILYYVTVVSTETPTSRSSDRQLVRAGCNRVTNASLVFWRDCTEPHYEGFLQTQSRGVALLSTLKHCLLMGHVNSHYGVHTKLIWGTVLCTLSTFKQPVRIHDFQPWSVKLTIPLGISLLVTQYPQILCPKHPLIPIVDKVVLYIVLLFKRGYSGLFRQ